jgi:hypothetical protein
MHKYLLQDTIARDTFTPRSIDKDNMPLNIQDIVDIQPAAKGSRPPFESSDGYRYVPITFRIKDKGPTVQDLVPYMVAATYVILSLLFLQWHLKSWLYKISDSATWSCCYALHHFRQPLPALYLASSYTIWNLCPGSLASKNLPGHKQFMRNLKTIKATETSAECMICWSEDCDLADLPCKHHFCVPCLQQMGEGEQFQTICTMCRKPLFGAHDRLMLITSKGTYVCFAITMTKVVLDLSLALMQHHYGWALFYVGMLGFMLAFPVHAFLTFRAAGISMFGHLLHDDREPARTRSQMRSSIVTLLCSVITATWNIWSDYAKFS